MPAKKITQTAVITSPPNYFQQIPVETSTLTIDEAWSPTWQASITTPYTAALAQVDPRQFEVILELTTVEEYGRTMSCAELTLAYSGTMTTLTAAFGGKTCAQITNLISFPYDSALSGYIEPTIRTNRLLLRNITLDHVEQNVILDLASEEALLQDWALVATSDFTPLPGIRGMVPLVNYALGLIGRELYEADPVFYDSILMNESDKLWKPGMTAYDWVYNIIKGARLYCRFDGRFVLRAQHYPGIDPAPLVLDPTDNLVSAQETKSRDGEFYTAAIITYRWQTGTTTNEVVDAYTSGRYPTKVFTETLEMPYTGPGAAAGYYNALQQRAETIESVAVVNWAKAWLAWPVTLNLPTGTRAGYLTKVALHYPSDQMEITTRIGLS